MFHKCTAYDKQAKNLTSSKKKSQRTVRKPCNKICITDLFSTLPKQNERIYSLNYQRAKLLQYSKYALGLGLLEPLFVLRLFQLVESSAKKNHKHMYVTLSWIRTSYWVADRQLYTSLLLLSRCCSDAVLFFSNWSRMKKSLSFFCHSNILYWQISSW